MRLKVRRKRHIHAHDEGCWFAAVCVVYMNCSVLLFDSFIFYKTSSPNECRFWIEHTCVLISNTSLKDILVDANLLCSIMTILFWCSSTIFVSGDDEVVWRCFTYDWSPAICLLMLAMSCFIINVSSYNPLVSRSAGVMEKSVH